MKAVLIASPATISANIVIEIATASPIHSGLRTHSHDHAINPVSFRAINRRVNRPVNPGPTFTDTSLVLLILFPCLFDCFVSQLASLDVELFLL